MDYSRTCPDIIDSKTVKGLVDAHAIQGAVVLGQPGGFAVLVKYGNTERAIAAQRSRQLRLWRHLDTAASYIRDELGVPRFEVDMLDHNPEINERKRPDTAERQRKLHEAAEHDAWFRKEVRVALETLENGTNRLIGDEEWKTISLNKRADLQRRIANSGR